MPDSDSTVIARHAALKSWESTVDRTERTRKPRSNSPASVEWHLARLDPERFAEATDEHRLAAAEAARSAYFVGLQVKAAAARRKAKRSASSTEVAS